VLVCRPDGADASCERALIVHERRVRSFGAEKTQERKRENENDRFHGFRDAPSGVAAPAATRESPCRGSTAIYTFGPRVARREAAKCE
jgi:hypothetical protein